MLQGHGTQTPLCEHCHGAVSATQCPQPNVSVVFCMNDGVFLCATCNDEVHKNKIAQRHVRVPCSDAPAWAYQEALAAGRVTSPTQVECSSSPNTDPACLTLDVVGESSWTPPAQPATASSLDSAQPPHKSESASCFMNTNIPHHKKQPSLPSHYNMAISTPDTSWDEAAGNHHGSNSNSYTPSSLGAEVAQEETQHNAQRLKLLGPSPDPTLQQQQQQHQQQHQQRMQQLPTQPLQHSAPLSHSLFSMQTIQEQQVMAPMSATGLQQHHQQLYAMRHPHSSHSNQSSAHDGMAFFGVQPPCPLNRRSSQEPSSHGGAASVDTTTVAGSANSHQSLAAMLERFGMPGSRETSCHGAPLSPLSGGLSANLEGSVHSTGTGLPPHMRPHPAQQMLQQQQQQQQQPSSLKSSQTDLVVGGGQPETAQLPHMGSTPFGGIEKAMMSAGFPRAHTSQALASHPSSQGLRPGMLSLGMDEGSVPSSLHKAPLGLHGQADVGHAHKVQKLGSKSPSLASKEQSIRDVIMAEVGFPLGGPARVPMPTAMDEDLPGEILANTARVTQSSGTGSSRDKGMLETLGMPPTHAAAVKHPHPHPLSPFERTSSSQLPNPAASGGAGGVEGRGLLPNMPTWPNHSQSMPSEQPFTQPFRQQQQGQQPPGSGPMHQLPLNFSSQPPELLASMQHGNGTAPHHPHPQQQQQQQQQQQVPDVDNLPMGFTYRPTAFQLSALNIEATPQSVIEARARALINSSSRAKGGPQQHRNHKGGPGRVSKTVALVGDGSDSDESGSASKLRKAPKAKQADKKAKIKVGAEQRVGGRRLSIKPEGSELEAAPGSLFSIGGLDRSMRGGSMQRIDEEVDQMASLQGKSKTKQGALSSPRPSASPRPTLQRTSSGHGGSASAGSTGKSVGSAKGAKGLGSASGGVVKNSSHHPHASASGATLRRALSSSDIPLDQSVVQKLVAAIQANPSAAPSSLLPNLPPPLQQQVLRSLSSSPAFQQQLQQQRGTNGPQATIKPKSTTTGSMPVPVAPHPPLPACTNPPLTWEGNMGGLLAGASSWSYSNLNLAGASSWSHPHQLAAQEGTRHGNGVAASTHGGSLYSDSLGGAACTAGDQSAHSRGGNAERSMHSVHGTEGSTHGGSSAALWGAGDGGSTHGGSLFGDGGSVHGGGAAMLEAGEAEQPDTGCLATELLASLDQEQGVETILGSSPPGGVMGAGEGSLHGGSIFGGFGVERLDDNKLQASTFNFPPSSGAMSGTAHDDNPAPTPLTSAPLTSLATTSGLGGGMSREVGELQHSPLITDEDLEALCGMEDPAQGPSALPLSKPFEGPTAIPPSLKLGSNSPRPDHHTFPFPHHLHSNSNNMGGLNRNCRSEPGLSPLGPGPAAPAFGGVGASRLQNAAPGSLQALQMQLGPQAGHENPTYQHDVFADQQVCSMLDALLDDHV